MSLKIISKNYKNMYKIDSEVLRYVCNSYQCHHIPIVFIYDIRKFNSEVIESLLFIFSLQSFNPMQVNELVFLGTFELNYANWGYAF